MRKESSPLISMRSAVSLKTVAMVLLSTYYTRGNCTVRCPETKRMQSRSISVSCRLPQAKTQPLSGWALVTGSKLALLHLHHIRSLRPFLTINDLKFDHVAFLQALVALGSQSAVVHEHVRAILPADKAKAFRIVEPFDGSFQFHFAFLGQRAARTLTPGAFPDLRRTGLSGLARIQKESGLHVGASGSNFPLLDYLARLCRNVVVLSTEYTDRPGISHRHAKTKGR